MNTAIRSHAAGPGADLPIETIKHGSQTLAIILRRSFTREGIEFLTPSNFSQQLGYMRRPRGYTIAPHVHKPVRREVHYTKEVLFIRSGRLRADFYDDNRTYLTSTLLEQGDVILLAYGGHGFEMLEECEMIEVKQGPYAGDEDKERFEPVARDSISFDR